MTILLCPRSFSEKYLPLQQTVFPATLQREILNQQQNCHPDRSEAQWRDLLLLPTLPSCEVRADMSKLLDLC
jgi:hypothetical protein